MLRKRTPLQMIVTYVLLLLYYGFFLIPMLWIVLDSFKTSSAVLSGSFIPSVSDLTFASYDNVWNTPGFPLFFRNSVLIALCVTALTLVVSSLGAYGLSKYRVPGRRSLLVAILLSQMFPPVLILVPFYTLILNLHLADTYLGMILSHTILALPFCMWMLKSYMDSVPGALIESALVDGSGRLGALVRIVLPTSLSGLAVVAFFAFVVSWGDYLFASIVSGSNNTATMPLFLYNASNSLQLNWGTIAAGTVINIVPVVVLFALVQRWLVRGLLAGAVKG